MSKIYSNIVPENKVRKVQKETLEVIADALKKSFGPKGSITAYIKNMDEKGVNISLDYTKDGHTIVKSILFQYPIERSVQDVLVELTRYVVKEVGDGTTSAILLCNSIFKCLCDDNIFDGMMPADAVEEFNKIITELNTRILAKGRECTLEDIYSIALISTNNNIDIAQTLLHVYEKFGMEVYVDIGISNEVDHIVKEYDGMTLDTGFTDICFVNDKVKNTAVVRNPKIYAFNDPIDTPEMLNMLDTILYNNILRCYERGSVFEPVPTVIFSKALSPDSSSYFETVVKVMNTYGAPLLMVSDIHQEDLYEDITKMCGVPLIKKYINPDIQDKDIEMGLAPTKDTILDFCGAAELVQADQDKTKIIRPSKMFNEDGTYSQEYKTILTYLETQVQKAKNENAGINEIGRLKRRLNSFKGSMIDFLVGGITMSDRSNTKASVEDAVLNCRSAVKNGVGYGANFMALSTLNEMLQEDEYSNNAVVNSLFNAYVDLYHILYGSDYKNVIDKCITNNCPLNIRTGLYDGSVLSSIKSDTTILETMSKILTLMYTCNQYLVQTPMHNVYIADED